VKTIDFLTIAETVALLFIEANYKLEDDVRLSLQASLDSEDSDVGREVICRILENADEAAKGEYPICQDTGFPICFVELGQDVHITGGLLSDAVNEGVRRGYTQGYLRKSMVGDPLIRKNTGDNTPAIIHVEPVPGEELKITVAPKGAGSENMSQVKMLKPSDGVDGVKKFVIDAVEAAGPNACPPIVVGVGLGGTIEKACLLAKKALLRPLGLHSPRSHISELESSLLNSINSLGIGPQGFGGRTTALAVNIETFGTHIASLPVAVNINCHVARHKSAVL
jgi:fumarate hydratase subunit alpha